MNSPILRRSGLAGLIAAIAMTSPAAARGEVYLSLMGEPFRTNTAGEAPFDQWLALADLDRDGAISRVELNGDAETFFATLDRNGDKVIDADEMARYEKMTPGRTRAAGGLAPPQASARPKPTSSTPLREGEVAIVSGPRTPSNTRIHPGQNAPIDFTTIPQPVAMADINLDRRVTLDEFLRTAGRRFTAADRNKDARLERRELR